MKWAEHHEMAKMDYTEILKSNAFKEEVFKEMKQKADEYKLNGMERVKKLSFHPNPFSVEDGLLTPTFKLKRNIAK